MISFPATITGIRTTSDGGLGITLHTQELTAEKKLEAMQKHNMFGWFLFKENPFLEEDIPSENADMDKNKTPSKRLRAVIFIEWKQAEKKGDFEVYYRARVDQYIDHIKSKLE